MFKMWWFMVVVVHKDYDSKESRNYGHRNLLKPLLQYFLTFSEITTTLITLNHGKYLATVDTEDAKKQIQNIFYGFFTRTQINTENTDCL